MAGAANRWCSVWLQPGMAVRGGDGGKGVKSPFYEKENIPPFQEYHPLDIEKIVKQDSPPHPDIAAPGYITNQWEGKA